MMKYDKEKQQTKRQEHEKMIYMLHDITVSNIVIDTFSVGQLII